MNKPQSTTGQSKKPLLPALFDRLRDDHPAQLSELPSAYTLTPSALHEIIRRDLEFLLNTTNLHGTIDFTGYPEAEASCINFGVPPLTGISSESSRMAHIDRFIRYAIRRFEPRLHAEVLAINIPKQDKGASRMPHFQIQCEIHAQPYRLAFTAHSAIDYETGRLAELKTA